MHSFPSRRNYASPIQREYWNDKKSRYPYRITVPHMGPEDINPRIMATAIEDHFLRVPFEGESHWGFLSQKSLDKFKALGADAKARAG